MKNQCILTYFIFFCCLLLPGLIFSEPVRTDSDNLKATPIVIKSKTMEMNNKLKMVTFSGDVNVKKDDFILDCDKMLAYYENIPDEQGENKGGSTTINKIIASGNVTINRAQGGLATAEKATYFQKDEKMILTGNPSVKRGGDIVNGNRITIFLKEDRVSVEGSEEEDITVTIAPRLEDKE